MSFSVDDLVSSLNGSHIGQEALDLAALQAQLSATLFSGHSSSRRAQQTCTTPLGRTPSGSISMSIDSAMAISRRGSISHHQQQHQPLEDSMEEDERMVEELLIPSSPPPSSYPASASTSSHIPSSPVAPSFSNPFTSHSHSHSHHYSQPSYHTHTHPQQPPPPSSSLFTSQDPFYLEASSNPYASNSAPSNPFAQSGRIAQGSRFAPPPSAPVGVPQPGKVPVWGQAQTAF